MPGATPLTELSIADRLVEIKTALVDESLAKQLQRSIERNSRMVARLQKLRSSFENDSEWEILILPIDAILKDEEPLWLEY
jgi:hypothetical protein